MENLKPRKKRGGLVLKRHEIESILSTAETVGIAFGVEKPGYAPNVRLKVYRVYEQQGGLLGDEVSVNFMMGAEEAGAACSACEDYKFQYTQKLKSNGFDFAYLKKSEFEELFKVKDKEEEVFIAGAVKKYGNRANIEGDWFTFSIAPIIEGKRKFNESMDPKGLGIQPRFKLMDGCPPIWDAAPVDVNEGMGGKIKFKEPMNSLA